MNNLRGVKKVCDILFRAKAINRDKGYHKTTYKNGDWVYGLVTRLYDERFENLPAEMTDINGVSGIEVDYKTIGQFTGLIDNNGNDIFEGDVVDYISSDVIGNPKTGTIIVEDMTDYDTMIYLNHSDELQIIGNIHDNPDILKGGEDNG